MILTFFDRAVEISVFNVDFAHKEIVFKHKTRVEMASSDSDETNYSNLLPRLEYEIGKVFLKSFYLVSYNIILAFDSRHCLTRYENVRLVRDNPRKPIDEADLDNLISQATWKVYEDSRKSSLGQLGLPESEILFTNSRVHDFKIDGRQAINPINHKGREVEIYLSQTFVNRHFFHKITSSLPKWIKTTLPVEAGSVASYLLSRAEGSRSRFVFAKVMNERTDLYSVIRGKDGKVAFWDYFKWGKNRFYSAIGSDLMVEPRVAESIVSRFTTKENSDSFRAKFKKIVNNEIITLLRGLKHAAEASKSNIVYIDFPVLNGLISEEFFPKIVRVVKSKDILGSLGFNHRKSKKSYNCTISEGYSSESDFLTLAPLLEYYFLPEEGTLNHLAKRRMRWLLHEAG